MQAIDNDHYAHPCHERLTQKLARGAEPQAKSGRASHSPYGEILKCRLDRLCGSPCPRVLVVAAVSTCIPPSRAFSVERNAVEAKQ